MVQKNVKPQDEVLDDEYRFRIRSEDKEKFISQSSAVAGKPHTILLREMITAFNDGRLRIIQTEEQKGKLYVD